MPWRFLPSILLTPIESEAVLLNTLNGENYVLNPLGLTICTLIEAGFEVPGIIEQLQQKFPEAQHQIPDDVQEFMTLLQKEGLLQEIDPTHPVD